MKVYVYFFSNSDSLIQRCSPVWAFPKELWWPTKDKSVAEVVAMHIFWLKSAQLFKKTALIVTLESSKTFFLWKNL